MQNSHFRTPPPQKSSGFSNILGIFQKPLAFFKKPLAFSAHQNFPKKSRKPPSLSLRGTEVGLAKACCVASLSAFLFFFKDGLGLGGGEVLQIYSCVFFWKAPPQKIWVFNDI